LEGVESMRVTYSRGGAYETAASIGTAWADVVSVRIELLLASVEDGVLAEPQPYTFSGTTVTPTDRRLRQVFTNTVAIRGRLR
jgi:type IV pilus assembly protein PilW